MIRLRVEEERKPVWSSCCCQDKNKSSLRNVTAVYFIKVNCELGGGGGGEPHELYKVEVDLVSRGAASELKL